MEIDKSITEAEKIRILIAEYNTLRAEIIARAGHGYQMLGFGLTSIVLLLSLSANKYVTWGVTFVVCILLPFGLWIFWRETMKEAKRIREIELDVNSRVKEDLLVWENLWGGAVTGLFGKGEPLHRSHLSSATKPLRTFEGKRICQ